MFIDVTISLPYSTAEVYAALLDIESLPRWQPSIESVVVEPDGAVKEGTRVTVQRKVKARTVTSIGEVTRLEPNAGITVESPPDAPDPQFRNQYRLLPDGEGTLLNVSFDIELSGLQKLLEPLLVRAARKEVQERYARLAQHLKSRAG